ncbi:Gfo/Idh/MocA family oxidoreductase [Shewanella sp. CG12_big_fil_rev_8_21_14_0_65_47_15]|uniref:Gfo/Idh/MocA family protein n=1 Tax=Shewanella sp. CG12_big_fil_rev_8_21_14_0_65_47_15 TaxID=1975537 RepID=UPI000CAF55E4|nr:Gfo/Idh/MocA family oxidoreductase [Shewanella sp. CG12_big_fil_rev_8_21_14_0_65_47_15]PIW60303.1 MAG: alpha-N-acetylgalactosaminidase [Shewanella sp. CG12_big_fil_rev_8_21_14_0_65_47_15]
MSGFDRRSFLKASMVTAAATALAACATAERATGTTPKAAGQSVMGLVAPSMDEVRVGLIGVGERGIGFVHHFSRIDGAKITAICDTDTLVLARAEKAINEYGRDKPVYFSKGEHAYRDLLNRDDVDIVVIATPWAWHHPMAKEAMLAGKHAFVEVPMAGTIEELWDLVDTAEVTQRNCMMMENVCYGRDELMVLNMVRQGLFGELLHGEAAYIHELRWQMKEIDHKTGSWRTAYHAKYNGNLYPTHGLGPVAQYMNINRGDRLDYLTSVSSPSLGRAAYAKREFPADHQRNQLKYIGGDMNTSLIKTVKGRSIMVQHDTTTPRPYSRHNLIQGTNGVFAGFPNRIALENGGTGSYHEWDENMDAWYAKYDHPLWTRMGKEAEENGGHGGMDFLMCWRMIYCLRNGEALDQDVYDGAAWSAVFPLSVASVSDRGNSKDFPDFTRGVWQTAKPLGIVG